MPANKTFEVDAMCCPGCAQNVQDAVSGLDGVETVSTDHGTDEVSVEFDDATVSEDDILQTIHGAGCGMA